MVSQLKSSQCPKNFEQSQLKSQLPHTHAYSIFSGYSSTQSSKGQHANQSQFDPQDAVGHQQDADDQGKYSLFSSSNDTKHNKSQSVESQFRQSKPFSNNPNGQIFSQKVHPQFLRPNNTQGTNQQYFQIVGPNFQQNLTFVQPQAVTESHAFSPPKSQCRTTPVSPQLCYQNFPTESIFKSPLFQSQNENEGTCNFPHLSPYSQPFFKPDQSYPCVSPPSYQHFSTVAQPVTPAQQKKMGLPSEEDIIEQHEIENYKSKYDLMNVNTYILPFSFSSARFFIIKSFNEENIFKSLVSKIWSSTAEGNQKLNSVYQESQASGCYPIFLIFSVNQSGQSCGVAQMTSAVDFDSNFIKGTQSKKWQGSFNVKWLYVKDIQNKAFKQLTNKLNQNKPVANSRDTQEVPFKEGLRMLEIFRDYQEDTSIFNDFQFFERDEFKSSNKAKAPQSQPNSKANSQKQRQPPQQQKPFWRATPYYSSAAQSLQVAVPNLQAFHHYNANNAVSTKDMHSLNTNPDEQIQSHFPKTGYTKQGSSNQFSQDPCKQYKC